MIHKIIKGSYFKGALRYVLDPNKGLFIGGTFGSHQSPSQIANEMREVAGDRLRKPVFHAVLSLRPGESLSNDQWNEAARRYLTALGYDDAPYVLVRHTNRVHEHVHIIASRVRYDGTVVSDSRDRFKGLAAVRELSREYGLSLGSSPSPRSLVASEVRALVRGAAEGRPSFATFLDRLESAGVRVTTHISPGKKSIQGISFHLDGMTFKASQLSRELSWSGLRKLGVGFDSKDLPLALDHSARQPRQDPGSSWSPEAIRDLSRRLRTLSTPNRAGGTASRDLARVGAEAFRRSANVARFLEGGLRPSEAVRRTSRALPAGDHLSLALSFLGAFRSPGAAALFLLRISQRAMAAAGTREAAADPAVLFLRQLAHAAAGDRPSFEMFRDRLVEAGVHLGPGSFVLPDRVIPGQALGLDATQLEKLGVQNARERFGRLDRPLRDSDRARGSDRSDSPGGHDSARPGLGSDRNPGPAPGTAPGRNREARAASSVPDGGADLRSHPSAEPSPAARRTDLGHGIRPDSHQLSSPRREPHSSPAPVVPHGAAPGSAPDRTPSRRTDFASPGGSPTGALGAPSGAFGVPDLARQLQALGEGGAEIRVRFPERTITLRVSPETFDQVLPTLFDAARRGAGVEIRSLDPRVQHLSGLALETVERARLNGAEPAAVLRRGDGTFDVWLRHSAAATPETLAYLHRALRAEYGQSPLGPSRLFGPVAGLDPAVRVVEATGRPYTRAQALADFFAASRRAVEEQLAQRCQAVGVSPLAQYRASNPRPTADREWSRFALRQGLAPRDVALELIRHGARANAGPRAQALYASRVLASTLPAAGARELPKQLVATASQVLGVASNVLSVARVVFQQLAHLTLGRS